jgi:hypothetical protein
MARCFHSGAHCATTYIVAVIRCLVLLVAAAAVAQQPPTEPERFPRHFPTIAGQRGLWFGSIHICRDVVVSAVATTNSSGFPAVQFIFTPKIQPRLKDETTRSNGHYVPVRINGRLVSTPYIEEPIAGVELELHGSDQRTVRKIAAAARHPCGKAAGR